MSLFPRSSGLSPALPPHTPPDALLRVASATGPQLRTSIPLTTATNVFALALAAREVDTNAVTVVEARVEPSFDSARSASAHASASVAPRGCTSDYEGLAAALFFVASVAYVVLDFAPPLGGEVDVWLLVALAFVFVIGSVLYCLAWRSYEALPTWLEWSAEAVNLLASVVYFVATCVAANEPASQSTLFLLYALQATSAGLWLIDAILYAAAWSRNNTLSRHSLRDVELWAHIFNFLPALIYGLCSLVSLSLFVKVVGTEFDPSRNIRGRLIAPEPVEVENTAVFADLLYLLNALFTLLGWWGRKTEQRREAMEERKGKALQ